MGASKWNSTTPRKRNLVALAPRPAGEPFSERVIVKPKGKKSKNGCSSCKKLKIKCNEERPSCEYCIHTKRQCIYGDQRPLTRKLSEVAGPGALVIPGKDTHSICNKSLQILNSMVYQMNVSELELQLLKFYVDFGGTFFSFNVQEKSFEFWVNVVPKLWCSSDIVKYALYTVSSARLLANYNYEDVYFDHQNNLSKGCRTTLKEAGTKYMQMALELIEMYYLMIDDPDVNAANSEDLLGQLYVTRKLCTASRILLSRPGYDGSREVANFDLIEVMASINKFVRNMAQHTPKIRMSSKYANAFDPEIIPSKDYEKHFKTLNLIYVKHLIHYVSERISASDHRGISYLNAISNMEKGSHQALYFNYPIALFRIIINISHDADFIELLKQEDHTAMKIMFYVCCLNSTFQYNTYERIGLHDEFFHFYKDYSKRSFKNSWEDEIDKNFHDWAIARSLSLVPFDLGDIRVIGEPLYMTKRGNNEQ